MSEAILVADAYRISVASEIESGPLREARLAADVERVIVSHKNESESLQSRLTVGFFKFLYNLNFEIKTSKNNLSIHGF